MPWLRAVMLVLGLAHVVGLTDIVFGDACEEQCHDDACSTDCIPGIPCHCHCPSTTVVAEATAAPPTPDAASSIAARGAPRSVHGSPDPREILHVPKRLG